MVNSLETAYFYSIKDGNLYSCEFVNYYKQLGLLNCCNGFALFFKFLDSQENGSANSIAPADCPSVRHIIKTGQWLSPPFIYYKLGNVLMVF